MISEEKWSLKRWQYVILYGLGYLVGMAIIIIVWVMNDNNPNPAIAVLLGALGVIGLLGTGVAIVFVLDELFG